MKASIACAVILALALTARSPAARAQGPATGEIAPLPAALKPSRLAATVLSVTDRAAQQRWYETVFGFVKIQEFAAPKEVVLSLDPKDPRSVVLVLQTSTTRQAGAPTYGRLVIDVDDASAVAAHLQSHGVATRTQIPNRAFLLNDPEGNVIEIYQSKPAAK